MALAGHISTVSLKDMIMIHDTNTSPSVLIYSAGTPQESATNVLDGFTTDR